MPEFKPLFYRKDDDKDFVTFRSTDREVFVRTTKAGTGMDRDTVLSLIQALTEWAYPAHTPEGPNRSLIEELIAKAVKDQVAAVLPLHLSPVACTHGGFCRDANGVQVIQCPEPDPEPCDVGHPRPPAAEDSQCADCGHDRDRHRPVCAVAEAGRGVCRCNAYKAPLPVREKTVTAPACGLCKQPWSDGHGQPGDPCSALQATGNVEDWHEALWRVQPSAPASEARYCDECGHSWESHLPLAAKCMATKGKSICGCTRRPE